jgi:hypothetical protein
MLRCAAPFPASSQLFCYKYHGALHLKNARCLITDYRILDTATANRDWRLRLATGTATATGFWILIWLSAWTSVPINFLSIQ